MQTRATGGPLRHEHDDGGDDTGPAEIGHASGPGAYPCVRDLG